MEFLQDTLSGLSPTRIMSCPLPKIPGPYDLDYFELNNLGTSIKHYDDSYHNDYPLDPAIFEISSNGEYFVTSNMGAIYSTSTKMLYLGTIANDWNRFNDFAFSADGNTIYASNWRDKSIFIISHPSLVMKEQKISGYSKYLFCRNGKLISLSMVNSELFNFGIEEIKLD